MDNFGHQSHRASALDEAAQLASRLAAAALHAATFHPATSEGRLLLGIADRDHAARVWQRLETFLDERPDVVAAALATSASPGEKQPLVAFEASLKKALEDERGQREALWHALLPSPSPTEHSTKGTRAAGRGRGKVRRAVALLGGSLMLLTVTGLVLATLALEDQSRVVALKAFAVLVLSFLPGWLFLRFLMFRTASVWEEYVLNLHRLGMDEPEHLPRPPNNSIYFDEWCRNGGPLFSSSSNIYRQKFEAYYGRGTAEDSPALLPRLRVDSFVPVVLATALLAVGWVAVLWQDSVFLESLALPWDLLRFAFLGSYVFILQMLMRRYFQADLKASAYLTASVRVVTAAIVVLVVHRADLIDSLAPGKATVGQELAVAFLIGFLPLVGLQALQKFAAAVLRRAVPALRNDYPLSDLDGLNVWYEARLLEEGIEDMQNLATANLVDVILHTRVPVGRLVDWVDQAHLYLHLQQPKRHLGVPVSSGDRAALRRLGIRTATGLEEAFTVDFNGDEREPAQMISPDRNTDLVEALRWHLNGNHPRNGASVTETILKTLGSAPNLKHVRAWNRDWRRPDDAGTAGPTAPVFIDVRTHDRADTGTMTSDAVVTSGTVLGGDTASSTGGGGHAPDTLPRPPVHDGGG